MKDNEIHLVIIGDEILSGKREDKHFKKALDVTKQNNYVIKSVSYLPDSEHEIQSKIENLKDKINSFYSREFVNVINFKKPLQK